jgi:hypothetical protein
MSHDVLYARGRRRHPELQSTLLASLSRRLLVRALWPSLACVCAWLTLLARPALGADANIEKQALTLQRRAIEEDSLNVNYPEAVKKLATAISKCGGDKCNATLKGTLYRDLGAMLILNGSVDDGRASFVKALGFDPSLELDPSYKSPMLEGLWSDAKKKAGVGGGAVSAGASAVAEAPPPTEGGSAQPPAGDFAHVPVGAQLVRTPLPVYAEYVGTEKLLRVVVKYRGAGMTDWRPFELRKMDTGYGGLIPCKDVAEGTMQYYIQGYGTSDDPVASSGSRTKPYGVPIKTQLSGQPPSLPGQEAPRQCAQSVGGSDCPPDFPGCHAAKKGPGDDCRKNGECESGQCATGKCVEKKGEGDECEKDGECASGSCSDDKCTAPKKAADETCDSDDDCGSGSCKDGKCSEGSPPKKSSSGAKPSRKIWIGFAVGLEWMALPQSDDVCKLNAVGSAPVNNVGYQCIDPSTSANFPGTNATANNQIILGNSNGDSVGGGLLLGNVRLLASFDYALGMNFLLGARAGYVLFTNPVSNPPPGPAFPPIHLEARVTYLFGKDALASSVAPMLFLAGGASEFDANIAVTVRMSAMPPGTQGAYPAGTRNENAWVTAGPLFGAAGVGVRFLASKGIAFTVAVKGQAAFGGSAGSLFGIAPEVGMQFGF